jgi:hypothetical protein
MLRNVINKNIGISLCCDERQQQYQNSKELRYNVKLDSYYDNENYLPAKI